MDPSSERAYADRPSATTDGANPSHRTPDFIPGWFKRVHPGTERPAAPTLDEAVRVLDDHAGVFPIAFLRSGEFVRPARPPQLGFVIGRMARDMELAVPPGYWLVRGDDGEIVLWRDEDFREKFSRRADIEWRPAALRQTDFVEDKRGWRGTQPAEGTRRALIYGALLGEEVLTADECLAHADSIESSLLDSQIAIEALDVAGPLTDNPYLPPEYKQRIVEGAIEAAEKMQAGEVGEIDDPDAPDAEVFASDGANIGGLHVVLGAQDGVPYVSLVELEHLFANLYEDISERQAKRQRRGEEEKAENTAAEPQPGEAVPYDHEDDRPVWKVELDRGLNHLRNAIADRMGL